MRRPLAAVVAALLVALAVSGAAMSASAQPSRPRLAATRTVTATVTRTVTATATVTSTATVTVTAPGPTVTVTDTGTPTPTGTTTGPTPTPTPTTTAPAAFPDASNTGATGTLTPRGSLTITAAGMYENLDITGSVRINASNVTLRNSRVTDGRDWSIIQISGNTSGVRLEDITVNGLGNSGTSGSFGIEGSATVVRANIFGVENGFVPYSDSVLQDSWIHGLASPGDPHIDGVQIDGGQSNVKLLHNTIDMREWGQTATVMVDNYFGPINGVTVDGNRLMGGGYTVYSDGGFNSQPITGVAFTNNRMLPGQFGYNLIRGSGAAGVVWSGNVNDTTGATIPK